MRKNNFFFLKNIFLYFSIFLIFFSFFYTLKKNKKEIHEEIDLEKRLYVYFSKQEKMKILTYTIERYINGKELHDEIYERIINQLFNVYSEINQYMFNEHLERTEENIFVIYIENNELYIDKSYMSYLYKDFSKIFELKNSIEYIFMCLKHMQPLKKIMLFLTLGNDGYVHEPVPVFGATSRIFGRTRLPFPTLWTKKLQIKEKYNFLKETMKESIKKEWKKRNEKVIVTFVNEKRIDIPFFEYKIQKIMKLCKKKKDFKILNFSTFKEVEEIEENKKKDSFFKSSKYLLIQGTNKINFGIYVNRMLFMGHLLLISLNEKTDQHVSVFAMTPFFHYIPLKQDLSDLFLKLYWLKKHPEITQKIVENAFWFLYIFSTPQSYQKYSILLLYEYEKRFGYVPEIPKSVMKIIFKQN